jgi:HSP20 family protein
MAWRDYRDLLRQMEFDMDRFTEEALTSFLDSPAHLARFWQPAADVHETDAAILLKLELAGVTVENVQVALSADGRQLHVSGTRAERQDERVTRTGCHQLEIYFGPFERTFTLPADFDIDRDGITATLRDGFLTITLPRRPKRTVTTRTIPIEVIKDGD